jgi:hypothetical protein
MLTGACMLLVEAALLLRIAPSAGQAFRIPGQRPTPRRQRPGGALEG